MRTPPAKPTLTGLCRGGCLALLTAAGSAEAADVPRFVSLLPHSPFVEPAPAPPLVTLVWFDVQEQLPDGFAAMSSEVRAIFAEIGVEVALRKAEPGDTFGGDSRREIAVIGLAEDPARRARPILGLVVRDGQPTRALWTFIGNIRRALGIDPVAGSPFSSIESALLARALGRVIAHEVVHAVAPDHPHDGAGLMKHALSRSLLLGPRRPFGSQCARSVLGALQLPPTHGLELAGSAELLLAIP